jgi:hypothetical protein
VQELIQAEIDRVNKKFARVEQIKKFFLLETQLSRRRRGAHAHHEAQAQAGREEVRAADRGDVPLTLPSGASRMRQKAAFGRLLYARRVA